MRILIGIILIALGGVSILFGDKKLNGGREGFMERSFPVYTRTIMKFLKYVAGCTFIYIGLRIIFDPWWY